MDFHFFLSWKINVEKEGAPCYIPATGRMFGAKNRAVHGMQLQCSSSVLAACWLSDQWTEQRMDFENRRLHYVYRHSPLDSLMSRAVLQASRRHTGRAPKFDSSMIQRLFILNARAGSASAARAADAVPALFVSLFDLSSALLLASRL